MIPYLDEAAKCLTCGSSITAGSKLQAYCQHCRWIVRKFQFIAHGKIHEAIKEAKLPKPSEFDCVDCGKPACIYDHRDYSEPYTVDPVCAACNVKRGPANWPNGLTDISYKPFIGGL